MKVVLFCGGLGMRLREYSENVPKPMVPVGHRPILWHLMKYYAHWGHNDFILCLGHRGEAIKRFFIHYEECASTRESLDRDVPDWNITFADTGVGSSIGERLRAVREHLEGEDAFLANYADGLTDLPLPWQLDHFEQHGKAAGFLSVKPNVTYHHVAAAPDGTVEGFAGLSESGLRINGGFFVFRPEIFRYLREGEDLVAEPFGRLIRDRQLVAYEYDGFWLAVDTAKDRARIDALQASPPAPWEVWEPARGASATARGG